MNAVPASLRYPQPHTQRKTRSLRYSLNVRSEGRVPFDTPEAATMVMTALAVDPEVAMAARLSPVFYSSCIYIFFLRHGDIARSDMRAGNHCHSRPSHANTDVAHLFHQLTPLAWAKNSKNCATAAQLRPDQVSRTLSTDGCFVVMCAPRSRCYCALTSVCACRIAYVKHLVSCLHRAYVIETCKQCDTAMPVYCFQRRFCQHAAMRRERGPLFAFRTFAATEMRMLRGAVAALFDMMALATRTLETFGPPVPEK